MTQRIGMLMPAARWCYCNLEASQKNAQRPKWSCQYLAALTGKKNYHAIKCIPNAQVVLVYNKLYLEEKKKINFLAV